MSINQENDSFYSRRKFLKSTAVAGGMSFIPGSILGIENMKITTTSSGKESGKSIIGSYGPWAANIADKPPLLSFRNSEWKDIESWRSTAKNKALELLSSPDIEGVPKVKLINKTVYDGLEIEEISWQLPYGRPTRAIVLKPEGARAPMPAILGLHDHGCKKYFGKRKITRTGDQMHPLMLDHQNEYYGGFAWANEIAKRGYVVLVHDAFAFASRRVLFEDMSEIPWGHFATTGMSDEDPEKVENILAYNKWAAEHESIMAKSLFCAGTTWPGVFLAEDQKALDVLSAREDVDSNQLGCAGLSGGGLRTVFLGGLDPRIKCAVCVGNMTTWKDFLLNKSFTHTWMTFAPLLPKYLDFPEILGLRVPLPTMTLSTNEDGLFTLSEMKKANGILQEVFDKAGASDKYKGNFYPGVHKFDAQMQKDAFNWFDKWLKD
ncbi:MAG: hypothetical protein J7L04_11575 [Bacteroidales bacterium]|nr:hypothetical protein [Bacteroidales bacterium]